MKTETKTPKDSGITMAEAARFLNISRQGVQNSYLPVLEKCDIDRDQKPMRIRSAALLEIATSRRATESEEPLMSEGNSPALERYRSAKAALAELDLHLRKNDLIEVARAKEVFMRWAVLVRRMGERLAKRYGPDASATVNETLASCRAAVAEICKNNSPIQKKKR